MRQTKHSKLAQPTLIWDNNNNYSNSNGNSNDNSNDNSNKYNNFSDKQRLS